jgi:hypothetical protein
MTIFHFGKRTGTDRYVNGPYRFRFTHNSLLAVLALAAVSYGAHVLAWG